MFHWEESSTIQYYYEGINGGTYPAAILELLAPFTKDCRSIIDICSGPGAFAVAALKKGWQVTAVDLSAPALRALEKEALLYPKAGLTTVCGDFLALDPPQADLAVASYCFGREMSQKKALAKILECARVLAVYVLPDLPRRAEFATENLLPAQAPLPFIWEDDATEDNLAAVAAEAGMELHQQKISCDFGCYYHEDDPKQLTFISEKTGVTDKELLTRHLQGLAQPRNGKLWLANLKPLKVLWIKK